MSSFDFINFVKYNNWGNIHLLTTAEQAPFERLTGDVLQRGESPYYTLHHMYYNERAWRLACEERTDDEPQDGFANLQSMKAHWQAEGERLLAYVESLTESDFQRRITPAWIDKSFTIGQVIIHLITHAIDHRSELGWYLTSLGHSPGDMDFIGFLYDHQL